MNKRSTYRNEYSWPYRWVALVLCVLYIAGPLKDPLGFGLHQIAHAIEQPASILGHEISNAHTSWEHEMEGASHDHALLQAVSTFFEALEQHDQQQEVPPSMAFLDKHFPQEIPGDLLYFIQKPHDPDLRDYLLSEGILVIELPPPLS